VLVPQHVEDADLRDGYGGEVRALGHHRAP
jgi:hypothetical protein